jgi:hypothetical protein
MTPDDFPTNFSTSQKEMETGDSGESFSSTFFAARIGFLG